MQRHSPDEERAIREAALDETLESTFPASDPLSTTPDPHDDTAYERAKAETPPPTPEPIRSRA